MRSDGLGLDWKFVDIDAPTLHIPSDFTPAIEPSDALCLQLERIKKVWVLDNEQSCRLIIDAILTEALLDEANEKLLGFCEVKNDWEGSGLVYVGNVDYMLGSSQTRSSESIDSHLLVLEAKVDWPKRGVAQALAEAGCLLKNRMAKGKMTPVFAVLTNALFFRFFAIDVDGVVYSSGSAPFALVAGLDGTYANSPSVREILRWFNWFITSIKPISPRSSSEDLSQSSIAGEGKKLFWAQIATFIKQKTKTRSINNSTIKYILVIKRFCPKIWSEIIKEVLKILRLNMDSNKCVILS